MTETLIFIIIICALGIVFFDPFNGDWGNRK